MDLYTSLILLTELTMIAMIVHVLGYPGFKKEQKIWFFISFFSVMLCAGAEYFSITFDDTGSHMILPLTVITVVQFSITPLLPVFFAGAMGLRSPAKIAGAFLTLNIIAEIACSPFGLIFYFTENGKYCRGDLYIIYEASFTISLVFLFISMVYIGRRFRQRDLMTLVMAILIMASGIAPLILFRIYSDYICIGICGCICYIYYNDLIQQDIKAELVSNKDKISNMQDHIITGLASLIESRDTYTGEHVARTSFYVKTIAERAKKEGIYSQLITDRFITLMYTLAPLHDVGKIVVSDQILNKPGRLTSEEYEEMKKHSGEGGKVIKKSLDGITDEEYLQMASDIATYHHEKWDGSGYPEGKRELEIPLCARIMAIADVFDALVSKRCYKEPIAADEAFEIIKESAGSHFDPYLTEIFLASRDEIVSFLEKHK